MKFFGGFIAGILVTILTLFVIFAARNQNAVLTSSDSLAGLAMLPEEGKCIVKSDVEIFQTLKPNVALAMSGANPDKLLLLLINYDGDVYYDSKKIKVPLSKCARQIGTYQYETKGERLKTVPAVVIK
jgi:hypothetical protein